MKIKITKSQNEKFPAGTIVDLRSFYTKDGYGQITLGGSTFWKDDEKNEYEIMPEPEPQAPNLTLSECVMRMKEIIG